MRILYVQLVFYTALCWLGIGVNSNESMESESISFLYNPNTHNLILRIYQPIHRVSKCYVITLTDDERQQIHTDQGMKEIERRRLAMLIIAKPTNGEHFDRGDRNSCGRVPTNGTLTYYTM